MVTIKEYIEKVAAEHNIPVQQLLVRLPTEEKTSCDGSYNFNIFTECVKIDSHTYVRTWNKHNGEHAFINPKDNVQLSPHVTASFGKYPEP